jgi:hypothetical protein
VEEWESREKLDRHFNSEQYRIILSLMEASDQFPEIKIYTVSKTEGLEAIEAARRGQDISHAYSRQILSIRQLSLKYHPFLVLFGDRKEEKT